MTSATLVGVEALPTAVEVAICNGLPGMHIVGMADTAIQEARERVRSAIQTCGFAMPSSKIVINLAPSHLKKSGSGFDLPIALGILVASRQLDASILEGRLFVGELSLEGAVRPLVGYLAFALCAKRIGYSLVSACAPSTLLADTEQYGLSSLRRLHHEDALEGVATGRASSGTASPPVDFSDICGHEVAKRALQVAAAGCHGALMVGPPGSGKTMLASRLATILPPLSEQERIEAAVIHSVAGEETEGIIAGMRPFRHPHHSITTAGLVGGGSPVRPGEISLAHHGTLFLDELAEFKASALQALRQPLESGEVILTRAEQTVRFPANLMLIAASNPCPCGYLGDKEHECRCTVAQINRYRSRIGGPLLDRIDIQLHVDRIAPDKVLATGTGTSSAALREGVLKALSFCSWRSERTGGILPEDPGFSHRATRGKLTSRQVVEACRLSDGTRRHVCSLADAHRLSGRALISLLKVSRTIADLTESDEVGTEHVAEAMCFKLAEGMGEG